MGRFAYLWDIISHADLKCVPIGLTLGSGSLAAFTAIAAGVYPSP
jgi:hypothetical protein